jgi:glycosyltransferase involved in cell wall biosynthesis
MTDTPCHTIVTLAGFYLPGYKAGGPVRSLANLVEALGNEFNFKILTFDRDLGDTVRYPGVVRNSWTRVGRAEVMYLSKGWGGFLRLIALLRSLDASTVLYLNSFFARRFSILAVLMVWSRLSRPRSVVLAPRGEFSPSALNLKQKRKDLYFRFSSLLGIYREIIWHASTALEEADIRRALRKLSFVPVATALSADRNAHGKRNIVKVPTARDIHVGSGRVHGMRPCKRTGQLRSVFLSRISPMKNLLFALKVLEGVLGDVCFDIYGPVEDTAYWKQSETAMEALPPNVKVRYMGMVNHEEVWNVFSEHDLLFLPTFGESFCHVICEALSAGCPVLISDQTPWRHLQECGAGWDLPLKEPDLFRQIVQRCVDADEESYTALRARAADYARMAASDSENVEEHRRLFMDAASESEEG